MPFKKPDIKKSWGDILDKKREAVSQTKKHKKEIERKMNVAPKIAKGLWEPTYTMDNQSSGALTLKEILLGITDSLNEAQHKLRNMEPYDEYGRPNTMYQIPYLDFNLQVTSEFESIPQETATPSAQSPSNDDLVKW